MRRLIVCCDGTWQSAVFQDDPQRLSNISRLYRAIQQQDHRHTPPIGQIKLYVDGVGTGEELIFGIVEGALGSGLLKKVREVYFWLASNFQTGDEIYLFGFSRGAYIARLVASLISLLGLLEPKSTLDLFPHVFFLLCEHRDQTTERGQRRHDELEKLLERIRKRREEQIKASEGGFLVQMLGLFETVPPFRSHSSSPLDDENPFSLSDTIIEPGIKTTLQGLAVNEDRPAYTPIIFSLGEGETFGQSLSQVWFPGGHKDVGGGYARHDLSDLSLVWLCSHQTKLSLDLDYICALPKNSSAPWGALAPHRGLGRFLHHRTRSLPNHTNHKTSQTYHPSLLQQIPSHFPFPLRSLSPATSPHLFALLLPLESKVKEEWPRQPVLSTDPSLESSRKQIGENLHSPIRRTTTIHISCTMTRHQDRCPLRCLPDLEKELEEEVREVELKVWGAGNSPGQARSR